MREIEFRGKRKDNEEWVCGNLVIYEDKYYICLQVNDHIKRDNYEVYMIEVIPETVGQYTGLKDKNGVKIYEGDIDRVSGGCYEQGFYEIDEINVIKNFIKDTYELEMVVTQLGIYSIEIIGNIHDNPGLLEGE